MAVSKKITTFGEEKIKIDYADIRLNMLIFNILLLASTIRAKKYKQTNECLELTINISISLISLIIQLCTSSTVRCENYLNFEYIFVFYLRIR